MGARPMYLLPKDKLQAEYEALKNIGHYTQYEYKLDTFIYSCEKYKIPLSSFDAGKNDAEIKNALEARGKGLALQDAKGLYKALMEDKPFPSIGDGYPKSRLLTFVNSSGIKFEDLEPGKTAEQIESGIDKAVSRYNIREARDLYNKLPEMISKTPGDVRSAKSRIDGLLSLEKLGIEALDTSVPKSEIEGKFHQADLAHLRHEYAEFKKSNLKLSETHGNFGAAGSLKYWANSYGVGLQEMEPGTDIKEIEAELRKPAINEAKNSLKKLSSATPAEQRRLLETVYTAMDEGALAKEIAPQMQQEEFTKLLKGYEFKTAGIPRIEKGGSAALIAGDGNIIPANHLISGTNAKIADAGDERSIDWTKNDSYTGAIRASIKDVYQAMGKDPEVQKLLEKPEWNRYDREKWERRLCDSVRVATFPHEIISKYRTVPDPKISENLSKDAAGNDITTEHSMNNHSLSNEHDCSDMSIDYSIICQRVENAMLPAGDGYKARSNYYRVTGLMATPDDAGYHAFIVSEKTAAVIEGTNGNYLPNVSPEYTFQHFAAGYPLQTGRTTYFSSRAVGTMDVFDMAAQRLEAIRSGDVAALNNLTERSSLYSRFSAENIATLQVRSLGPDALGVSPDQDFLRKREEVEKIAAVVKDAMGPEKTISKEELEKIKRDFGDKNVSYVNNTDAQDAIAYKGVILPVTFDRSVAENAKPVNAK